MVKTYIIENVEALWPKIDRTYVFNKKENKSVPCDPRETNAEFSIQWRMDDATAKALFKEMQDVYKANRDPKWAEKLDKRFVKDDNGMYTHKAVLKGSYNNEITKKPVQVDSSGNLLPEDFRLTTGSTVNVAVQLVPYDFGGKQNISLRLKAVQVIKLVQQEVQNPFGAVEGGFVLEDANPFAQTATPAKSNNVLADDEPTPIKKTAPKAAKPAESDDLDSIVDGWDD